MQPRIVGYFCPSTGHNSFEVLQLPRLAKIQAVGAAAITGWFQTASTQSMYMLLLSANDTKLCFLHRDAIATCIWLPTCFTIKCPAKYAHCTCVDNPPTRPLLLLTKDYTTRRVTPTEWVDRYIPNSKKFLRKAAIYITVTYRTTRVMCA